MTVLLDSSNSCKIVTTTVSKRPILSVSVIHLVNETKFNILVGVGGYVCVGVIRLK
jgi:hypothetical protein